MSEHQLQVLPEWIATLVGRLVLENEAMRQALAAQAASQAQPQAENPAPQ